MDLACAVAGADSFRVCGFGSCFCFGCGGVGGSRAKGLWLLKASFKDHGLWIV